MTMKFKLSTSGRFYDDNEHKKNLEGLGFTFTPNDFPRPFYISDRAPDIEINTLEELMAFSQKFGELVISEGEIEIYDNYRE
jgi:hypothetical protein